MENMVSGTTGLVHLIASIIALITGLFVLSTTKGTKTHKQIGYVYSISMILLNLTAFMIYKLYGKFGIFHWFAVISCLTLFAGLYPVLTKKSKNINCLEITIFFLSFVRQKAVKRSQFVNRRKYFTSLILFASCLS
jgi:uncharacterized membrane protein